jgi:hypothetical protein
MVRRLFVRATGFRRRGGFGFARRRRGTRIFTTPPGPITTLLRGTRTSTVLDLAFFLHFFIARTLQS